MRAFLCLGLMLLATQPVAAAGQEEEGSTGGRELAEGSANLDFIIFNRTGQTITSLSISPRGEESWSDNLLRHREVMDNERAAAAYTRDVELCEWDVKVTYESGRLQSWPAIDLCDTTRVELR
jgi:hypothetical protein